MFTWGVYCPQSLCLFPKTMEIERNGTIGSPVPANVIPSGGTASFAVIVDKDGWANGDCFRIRLVAPAGDGKAGHFDYSDFSEKACAPTP
ncbi:MAG: hypothetical protein WB615_12360 [Candidatus Tumulicola sp.]